MSLPLIQINGKCEVPFYFVCICQKCYIISVKQALGLPCRELWGLAPWGPKVPLELNNGALLHMAQRSEGFLQNPYII